MGYIYKITNNINDKVYIGQTIGPIQNRWRQHQLSASTENKKKIMDGKLQRAFRKYGIEHFQIEQVEECANELLNERECYWIEHYNSLRKGYNSTIGGANSTKYQVAIVESGQIKKIYNTLREAASDNNCDYGRTCDVCAGRRGSTHGLVFRKLDADGQIIEPPSTIHRRNRSASIPIIATRIADGAEFYFESLCSAGEALNRSESRVSACLLGKTKSVAGHTIRRVSTLTHYVYATSVTDYHDQHSFITQKEASQKMNVHPMAISNAMTGRALSGMNYFWTDHKLTQEEYNMMVERLHTHYRQKEMCSDSLHTL